MAISDPSQRMWGRYEYNLDDKGRVIVPPKFRDKLGEEFILTTGPGKHIRVYPMLIWEEMEKQLVSADVHDEYDPNLQLLQRMFGSCETVSFDQQFRLSLPRYLREWAELRETQGAVIVGNGTRLEIWNIPNWQAYSAKFTEAEVSVAASQRKFGATPRSANGNGHENTESRQNNGSDEPGDSNGLN